MTEKELQNLAISIYERQREKLSRETECNKSTSIIFALENFLKNAPKRMRSARARPQGNKCRKL